MEDSVYKSKTAEDMAAAGSTCHLNCCACRRVCMQDGFTALCLAVGSDHMDCAGMLVERGASVGDCTVSHLTFHQAAVVNTMAQSHS